MRKILIAGLVLGLTLTAVSAARADTLGDILAFFGFATVQDDGGPQPNNDGGGSGSVA